MFKISLVLSHVQLFVAPWTAARQAPLSMKISRQEYWSGLPLPTPGDLPDPGFKPISLSSPAVVGVIFTTKHHLGGGAKFPLIKCKTK